MKFVETIKIDNGVVQHYDYHSKRAQVTTGICLPEIIVPQESCKGIVKCRVVYDNTVTAIEFTPYITPIIQSLKVIDVEDYFYDKKSTHRQQIQELYQNRGPCDDILITINGVITDTSFCNIVLENEDGLFTPQHPLLLGTKRAFLIDQNIIKPRHLTIDDLPNYQYIHLINAMIELDNPSTIMTIKQITI